MTNFVGAIFGGFLVFGLASSLAISFYPDPHDVRMFKNFIVIFLPLFLSYATVYALSQLYFT